MQNDPECSFFKWECAYEQYLKEMCAISMENEASDGHQSFVVEMDRLSSVVCQLKEHNLQQEAILCEMKEQNYELVQVVCEMKKHNAQMTAVIEDFNEYRRGCDDKLVGLHACIVICTFCLLVCIICYSG